ncbi:hypothetical protein CEUSTIGMA_g7960.t1 [Chlamydomonas eustigma]|uniref:2Fe-2S ferredoxin-type domain-containing protein n=1 Tax=Chlamydomonas eustigma TaxID=1157962 RepID=A0A250XCD4_9CHLO|nr:hypothetical protein CEUSTIGMA_g7960.t1 [Chlamydomonas eustigma]|eukprot:GAX80522.1 hypothetical protein CEUSTIGMA_g7960.t1 [Chlamydomonas eustigma]
MLSSSYKHVCVKEQKLVTQSRPNRILSHIVLAIDTNCKDVVGMRKEVASGGKVYKIKFLASGGDFREAECPDNMYILDAAEKAGIDLPATCRGGICGACVARVSRGTVDSTDIPDLEFTVSAEEQAEGMALICMCRPMSDCEIETQSDWGLSLGFGDWKGASGKFTSTPDPLMGSKLGSVK